MRKLTINWYDFELAVETPSAEMNGFLDVESGKSFLVADETTELLQQLLDEAAPGMPVEEVIAHADVPGWQREALLQASRVENDVGGRLLDLGELEFKEEYRDLQEFTAKVKDAEIRQQLERAIHGPGAFGRFRAVVHDTFHERQAWFAFRTERRRQTAADWLAGHDIEVEWVVPTPVGPAAVPPREHLLAGVLKFTRAAAQIPGVSRIALLGSLTRDQFDPKDADVLVTVSDAMDLAALAKAGRKLAGHAQQLNRGADVFLANERGEYIGRACHWRECAPGIRRSCDAAHCGRREYLHDDLQAVRLKPEVVAAPPIDLWPQVQARVTPPADVERFLLVPLRSGTA